MSSDALDGPTTKTFQAPNVTSSKVEKPSFEIIQPRDRIVCHAGDVAKTRGICDSEPGVLFLLSDRFFVCLPII